MVVIAVGSREQIGRDGAMLVPTAAKLTDI
jgi:hypothetical protein